MYNDKSRYQQVKFLLGGSLLCLLVAVIGLSVLIAAQGLRLYNGFNELMDSYF